MVEFATLREAAATYGKAVDEGANAVAVDVFVTKAAMRDIHGRTAASPTCGAGSAPVEAPTAK